jgi:hypothetical protein
LFIPDHHLSLFAKALKTALNVKTHRFAETSGDIFVQHHFYLIDRIGVSDEKTRAPQIEKTRKSILFHGRATGSLKTSLFKNNQMNHIEAIAACYPY